jgi:hypothetical protein
MAEVLAVLQIERQREREREVPVRKNRVLLEY